MEKNIELYHVENKDGIITVDYGFGDHAALVRQQLSRQAIENFAVATRANIIDVYQGGTWVDEVVSDVKTLVDCALNVMVLKMIAFYS